MIDLILEPNPKPTLWCLLIGHKVKRDDNFGETYLKSKCYWCMVKVHESIKEI